MSFTLYDASAPVFAAALKSIPKWLDKALAEGKSEARLMEARLAPDMLPFPAQIRIACDTSKFCVARLAGVKSPVMADNEATFAELKERCKRTVAFIESVDRAAIENGGEEREVTLNFGNGMGYQFKGRQYLSGFALPNFFFHVATTYGLLRAHGVSLGKGDYLRHLGAPVTLAN